MEMRARAAHEMRAIFTCSVLTAQATAVAPVEPEGCDPIIVRGAWRPCDAPDWGPGATAEARAS